MTSQQLQRLFQPFDRLGREKGDIDGLGLGMSIARQLVEAMDGRITVDSAPNVGTAFVIDLPAGQAGSQPLLRVASVGQSQESASKIGDDQSVSIQFLMAAN